MPQTHMDIDMDTITVERKHGPPWIFARDETHAFRCKQREHTYRIIFEDGVCDKPIWIALELPNAYVTCERAIGAVAAVFMFGRYEFGA